MSDVDESFQAGGCRDQESRAGMSDQRMVWIKSEPALDGSGYVVTLEADEDTARVLTPDEAMTYAAGVLTAVSRAEYDAAVSRQMTRMLELPMGDTAGFIRDLRADRPPLDSAATAPISLEPGVNQDLAPFLVISVNGRQVGQWDTAAAREHAMFVLMSVAVADLDSGYLRILIGSVGVDQARAFQTIDALSLYRDES